MSNKQLDLGAEHRNTKKVFGNIVKRERKQRGYTQETFAEALRAQYIGCPNIEQMTHFSVRNWEQGRTIPEVPILIALCDFFNCTFDYLFGNIPAKDHDASYVCEYTGLSFATIETLYQWNKMSHMTLGDRAASGKFDADDSIPNLTTIDKLITSPEGKDFLLELQKIENTITEARRVSSDDGVKSNTLYMDEKQAYYLNAFIIKGALHDLEELPKKTASFVQEAYKLDRCKQDILKALRELPETIKAIKSREGSGIGEYTQD